MTAEGFHRPDERPVPWLLSTVEDMVREHRPVAALTVVIVPVDDDPDGLDISAAYVVGAGWEEFYEGGFAAIVNYVAQSAQRRESGLPWEYDDPRFDAEGAPER